MQSGNGAPEVKVTAETGMAIVAVQTLNATNRKLMRVIYSLVAFIGILVVIIFSLTTKHAEELRKVTAYAVTPDGRFFELEKIKGELYNESNVSDWALRSIIEAHTFTFNTINGQHQKDMLEYMRSDTRDDFIKSLRKDGIINEVLTRNGVTYANPIPNSPPSYIGNFITDDGIKIHRVSVQVNFIVDTRAANGQNKVRQMTLPFEVYIGEVGLTNSRDGLLIGQVKRVNIK